ncbi:MAG: hypothetical protein RIM80_09270 [Alphaproteobacteria bacterium]
MAALGDAEHVPGSITGAPQFIPYAADFLRAVAIQIEGEPVLRLFRLETRQCGSQLGFLAIELVVAFKILRSAEASVSIIVNNAGPGPLPDLPRPGRRGAAQFRR